jgi:hypothetical protein
MHVPPSMTLSALSSDTFPARTAGQFVLAFFLKGPFASSCTFDQGSLLESCGGNWFHQPSIRSLTSDHDSFFRRRDRSREQGAQSA